MAITTILATTDRGKWELDAIARKETGFLGKIVEQGKRSTKKPSFWPYTPQEFLPEIYMLKRSHPKLARDRPQSAEELTRT